MACFISSRKEFRWDNQQIWFTAILSHRFLIFNTLSVSIVGYIFAKNTGWIETADL